MKMPPVKYDMFKLEGGFDQLTPTLSLPGGVVRSAQNFEISTLGGYTRIPGYERFDGHAAPSSAVWGVITLSAVTGINLGDTIGNAASSPTATGTVIAIDANNNVVFTQAAGAFAVGNSVYDGATLIGTIVTTTNFTPTSLLQATYTNLAATVYRNLISQVPGSGPIRGVVYYTNTAGVSNVYAWRNNAGGSAMAIYKSSSTGWTLVPLGYTVPFSTGVGTQPPEGSTIYGATSHATAVVARVANYTSATWATGSGNFVVSSTTGTFQNGEAILQTNGSGAQVATCTGPAVAITLQPNGRVQTSLNSFGDNTLQRIYGADGVNRGFEFDGTVYVPITTGMPTDTPVNVNVHKNYLFFSFGPSVQNSGIGTPYIWSPVFGANEFILPEVVTCFLTMPGTLTSGAMAIFTRDNTYLLYGTGISTWNLVPFNQGVGGCSYTAQNMENAYALDDRGVISIQTTLAYGNFDSATLTLAIRPYIQARRNLATASALNREKSQYRVFYSDGSAIYLTIVNGEMKGTMPMQFIDPVNCWCDGPHTNSSETSYYGGTNTGYVYNLDIGTSFDGANISAYFTLNYNNEQTPRVYKRYRRGSLEVQGSGYADFYFGYSLGYGTTTIDQPLPVDYPVPFSPAIWDLFVWDMFTWDGATLTPDEVDCNATGENISVTITSNSAICTPFTINSIILHYTPRRGIR